jgi:phage terminase small subunit
MDKKKMSLAELETTVEFQRLTPKQQLWVATYISAGLLGHYDTEAATLAAYKCKSRESARVMGYSMAQNPRVIDVLNLHFGRDATQAFLEDVNRAIRNRKLTVAQMEAMMLKSRILGIGTALRGRPKQQKPKPEKKSKKTAAREEAPVSGPNPAAW